MRVLLLSLLAVAACSGSPAAPAKPTTTGSTWQPTSFSVEVSGTGRPVIFIPGLTCDGHVWDDTVAHLGGKVQAHVLSLRGFAGAPPIDKELLPTVREELVTYIRENHLEKPIIVGHSLGGFMTYWVAETAPDSIAGGVAVDGAPFFSALMDPKATAESAKPGATAMRDRMAGTPDQFKAGVKMFMGAMMREPDKHADLVDASTKSDPKTSAEAMYVLMTTDLRPDLAKIKAPILVIAADADGQMPRDAIEATWNAQLQTIPSHELIVVEHSKHFVMQDQPDAFYAALDAYLAKH
jgi:pimeloyl-ACP methyl ester carboxylesterase